jgi:hypothetical protein
MTSANEKEFYSMKFSLSTAKDKKSPHQNFYWANFTCKAIICDSCDMFDMNFMQQKFVFSCNLMATGDKLIKQLSKIDFEWNRSMQAAYNYDFV